MFIHGIAWSLATSFLVSYLLWRKDPGKSWSRDLLKSSRFLRLLHTMNVRFSLLDIAQRILCVTLPNFQ